MYNTYPAFGQYTTGPANFGGYTIGTNATTAAPAAAATGAATTGAATTGPAAAADNAAAAAADDATRGLIKVSRPGMGPRNWGIQKGPSKDLPKLQKLPYGGSRKRGLKKSRKSRKSRKSKKSKKSKSRRRK